MLVVIRVLKNNAKSYGLSGFVPSVTFINQNRSVLKGILLSEVLPTSHSVFLN